MVLANVSLPSCINTIEKRLNIALGEAMPKYGFRMKDFKTINEYQQAVKAAKKEEENQELREFIAEQVNGTIFAHEGSEGDII